MIETVPQQKFLTLAEASEKLPGNPSISSLRRWHAIGVHGIRLKTRMLGGRRHTTEEWANEFYESVTVAAESSREGAANAR